MIRVLALVPYPSGRVPGQRYRIEQWAPILARDGIELSFSPFLSRRGMEVLYRTGHTWTKARETLKGYLHRVGEALRGGSFDVAYVYREASLLGPPWIEGWLARRLPLVYDFDDAIYLAAASDANAWAVALKPAGKTGALCRLARHVTVGNETLAAFAAPLSRAVTVIPSSIDMGVYTLAARPPNPKPVVGWTGSVTTLPHLAALAPALARLKQLVDHEVRVIGAPLDIPGVDALWIPWRAESEAEDLRILDVGLMPLPDDEWSRGKCGMKALQYMALGIPPVVSPVGVNAAIVQDGVNGFHARSEEEWVDRIARLLRDPDLRARMGVAARRTVEECFNAGVQAPRMARVLREAAGS